LYTDKWTDTGEKITILAEVTITLCKEAAWHDTLTVQTAKHSSNNINNSMHAHAQHLFKYAAN